jgi:hypothetical protein
MYTAFQLANYRFELPKKIDVTWLAAGVHLGGIISSWHICLRFSLVNLSLN